MGLRLRDDFEIRYDDPNNRTILENLNTGEQFIFNDDGTTNFTPPGITKTDEAVTFNETDVTVSNNGTSVDGGSIIGNTSWDILLSSFAQSFDPGSQDGFMEDVTFRPDGTQMYLVGNGGDSVYEYALSTPYDVTTSSFTQSFNVGSEESNPAVVVFKPDGTKMYVTGTSSDSIHEYDLSTAWNVTTASLNQSFNVSTEETAPQALTFKSDGTSAYIVGGDSTNVYQYDLSTAWDISSASLNQSFDVSAEDTGPEGLTFRPDGTQMYLAGDNTDTAYQYELSTAWDISSASLNQSFDVSSQTTAPTGIALSESGVQMYITGYGDQVYEYSLSTAYPTNAVVSWDAPIDIESWDLATFQADADGGSVTVDVGETLTTEFTQSFDVSGQDTAPSGIHFRSDGTQMYVMGFDTDSIYEYALSTAWDVSSAVLTQSLDVSAQDASPRDVTFRSDGTQMYVCGESSAAIYEYSLSTAWDISTTSLTQSFSVSGQDTLPQGVTFRSDGTQMYVMGFDNDSIYEYALSTAWDVSTASLTQSLDVSAQDTIPRKVTFRSDGTQMYVIGSNSNSVYEYALSTAWDISTASLTQSFDVSGQETQSQSVFFRGDGTQMYVTGTSSDSVHEYSIGEAWTVGDVFSSILSDITRNENISSVPTTTDVDLRLTFDGTQGVDFPSVQYAARRYNR